MKGMNMNNINRTQIEKGNNTEKINVWTNERKKETKIKSESKKKKSSDQE